MSTETVHHECECWDCLYARREREREEVAQAEVIASLRSLATFLKRHPDVPADASPSGLTRISYCCIGDDLVAMAKIDAIAKILGVDPKMEERNSDGRSTYSATREFGCITYYAFHILRKPGTIQVVADRLYEVEAPARELPATDDPERLALVAGGDAR